MLLNKIRVGADFSGAGAFDQALIRLGIKYLTVFACDMDKYARQTYIHNYGTEADLFLLKHPDVKFCDDVYYRLFIDRKLTRPTITDIKKLLTIQEDTARLFSFYYPWNVRYRKTSLDRLDIYMTSPPCQAFSLAGKRKGEEDNRGMLFYNSHEFIQKNKPRYFIFENVKGLLSDDNGKTFQRWVDYLGGKSVNGNPVIFPHENSVPYHIYYQVLNAKNYGVPQNRERIFIVGIRDDEDNNFTFPKPFELEKRLKDVLETNVDEKYFLSDTIIRYFLKHKEEHKQKDNVVVEFNLPGNHEQNSRVYNINGVSPTLTTMQGGGQEPKIVIEQLPRGNNIGGSHEICPTITSNSWEQNNLLNTGFRIRKLTPRECFRLMDFPDSFIYPVSNSQAYKQAGNSIVVNVLAQIINKLNL